MQNQGKTCWSTDLVLGGLGQGFGSLSHFEADSIKREEFTRFSPWRGFSLAKSLISLSFVAIVSFFIFV